MPASGVSVTTAATLIAAKSHYRTGLILENLGSASVTIGDDNTVVAGSGPTLAAGEKWIWDFEGGDKHQFFYRGDIYGIVASGTVSVGVLPLVEARG